MEQELESELIHFDSSLFHFAENEIDPIAVLTKEKQFNQLIGGRNGERMKENGVHFVNERGKGREIIGTIGGNRFQQKLKSGSTRRKTKRRRRSWRWRRRRRKRRRRHRIRRRSEDGGGGRGRRRGGIEYNGIEEFPLFVDQIQLTETMNNPIEQCVG